MFLSKDYVQITDRGSKKDVVLQQIQNFRRGFPYLEVLEAATIGDGISVLSDNTVEELAERYDKEISEGIIPIKFVPASGAASRMFKALFEALEACIKADYSDEVIAGFSAAREFLLNKEKFAFFPELEAVLNLKNRTRNCSTWIDFLLNDEGLGYGSKPKGLLKFHKYEDCERTPFEEHLVEGTKYACDHSRVVRVHFTVSPEHQDDFEKLLNEIRERYEMMFNVKFEVSFSVQKPSTDTIAVDLDNNPFREIDGSLHFRPGGHGALIENLNELNGDLIFIKNIDNVVPDRLKGSTTLYKKALGGLLLKVQKQLFMYQRLLDERHHSNIDSAVLAGASNFLENTLNVKPPEDQYYTEKEELYFYLKSKLNRPLRVCGMVKNEEEPGGGPFWAKNSDGTISLQIVEESQIDPISPAQQNILKNATHFNPVDLICATRNYKGEQFDLIKFIDPETGFISVKSKDGKELKAQELPGLWNGAMSDWNTIFAEVPIETFNPVKTIADLLREQHL